MLDISESIRPSPVTPPLPPNKTVEQSHPFQLVQMLAFFLWNLTRSELARCSTARHGKPDRALQSMRFIVPFVTFIFAVNVIGAETQKSESALEQALREIHAGNWQDAMPYLYPQPPSIAAALDDYLLAVCAYHIGDAQRTAEFARKALSASPPLDQQYIPAANDMMLWARNSLSHQEFKVTFLLSVPRELSTRDLSKDVAIKQQQEANANANGGNNAIEHGRQDPALELELLRRQSPVPCRSPECSNQSGPEPNGLVIDAPIP